MYYTLTGAQAEAMVDRIAQERLRTDRAYLNAEDAVAQSAREDEIVDEVWADINANYEVI